MSLGNSGVGKWDQFAQHKKMTGLDSTYDENHYTTKIDRSRSDYEQRLKDAERIAREIEGSSSTNAHVAEERGQKHLDDSGLDEEAKYSPLLENCTNHTSFLCSVKICMGDKYLSKCSTK